MKNAIILAGCVIRNEEGRLLLLHRNKKDRVQWELPGGKLEPNESPETAAIREIEEELGVKARVRTKLGEAAFHEGGTEHLYVWFDAVIGEEPHIAEPQTFDDLHYFHVSELESRNDLSANLQNLVKSGVLEDDLYRTLFQVVALLDKKFPDGNDIFQRVSRLAEETGELAQVVNHWEGTGIKRQKYGEPDVAHLAKEVQDVMRAAIGIARHYGIEKELEDSIRSAHRRLLDDIPA